jgi:hypothetical protein
MPVSDLFPGLFHTVEAGIEGRLREFELRPDGSSAKRGAAMSVSGQIQVIDELENDGST